MKSRFSLQMCLWLMVAMPGCRGARDVEREPTGTAQQRTAVTPASKQTIQSEPRCPRNGAIGMRSITFARADSLGRALLSRAGIDARNDCTAIIAETDSSVILGYSPPQPAKDSLAGRRVLHYGGGIVVEVMPAGRARWLYATQ